MSLEICASHGIKLKFQLFVTFSRVHLGLGEREEMTLERQGSDISVLMFKRKKILSSRLCGEPNFQFHSEV